MKSIEIILLILCSFNLTIALTVVEEQLELENIGEWSWDNCNSTLIKYSDYREKNQSNQKDDSIFMCQVVVDKKNCEIINGIESMNKDAKEYYDTCVIGYYKDQTTTVTVDNGKCKEEDEKCDKCMKDDSCKSVLKQDGEQVTSPEICKETIKCVSLTSYAKNYCISAELYKCQMEWFIENKADDVCVQQLMCQTGYKSNGIITQLSFMVVLILSLLL